MSDYKWKLSGADKNILKVAFFLALILSYVIYDVYKNDFRRNISDYTEQTNVTVANQCSGTLLSTESQLVLTNHHCIEHVLRKKKPSFKVVVGRQFYRDGAIKTETRSSRIIKYDEKLDLALLKITGKPMISKYKVRFTSLPVEQLQRVYVIGNPAMEVNTVFQTHVNYPLRLIKGEKYFQFRGVVKGNSGGSVYSEQGRFLGIPSLVRMYPFVLLSVPIGELGLAVPTDVVVKFMKKQDLRVTDEDRCVDFDCSVLERVHVGTAQATRVEP